MAKPNLKLFSPLFSLVFSLILLLMLLPATAWAAGGTGVTNGWYWKVLDDGTLSITGCTSLSAAMTLPDKLDAGSGPVAVTRIESNAFKVSNPIFFPSKIKTFSMPDSVTSIGDSAFHGCSTLTSVILSKNLQAIGVSAFNSCSALASITIPDSVETIGNNAFLGCSGLASLTLNASAHLESIGSQAFVDCVIRSISLPDSVISIGAGAFSACRSLESVTLPDNAAFTAIPDSLFAECKSLQSLTIPTNVTSIGADALNGCNALSAITVSGGNTAFSSEDGVLYNADKTTLICHPAGRRGTLDIPVSVTEIGPYAFLNSTCLTGVSIPNSVTKIDEGAFFNCNKTEFEEPAIPDSVTSIGAFAFNACNKLTEITIPEGITSLGKYTFYNCSDLLKITFPESLTNIGEGAFMGCDSLSVVIIPEAVESIGNYAFSFCAGLTKTVILGDNTAFGSNVFLYAGTAGFAIYGHSGSTAQTYAGANSIRFYIVCIVSFETGEGTAVPVIYIKQGNKISEPVDPVLSGFIFDGWYQDEERTDSWNFGSDTVSGDTILYAKWSYPVNIAAIPGVTAPARDATPVSTITEMTQYTGSVTWSPADSPFKASTVYTATITLTPKTGYTLAGVAENFFTVAGATATSAANSGVITAVFPATEPAPITIVAIPGVTAPARDATPVSAITETTQYTGSVTWSPADSPFTASTVYTATITLTPKTGYTLAGVAENFFTVAGATATNAANSGVITAVFPATEPAPVTIAAIPGVTAPARDATPVSTITETTQYTGSVAWSPADSLFAGEKVYTATITLTPKIGYTLTGVGSNFFTVAGATATNEANSDVITAVFPATEPAPITIAAISGVTAPARDATPVSTITETDQYTGTVTWNPADNPFAASTVYTATITLTPKTGYTLAGVGSNFFTVAGATATNAANSGVITAVFPATEPTPITIAAISGVTAPARDATPVSTITETDQYTGTVTWNPADNPFAASTVYTATITLTPKTGYTLAGVGSNFFTVAGATATNAANSGVITAVFPATEPAPITIAAISGVTAPARDATPVSTITETTQYTGSVTWSPADSPFAGEKVYTATITLTPKTGYTLAGVVENFFTVAGATATNAANSGVITAVFPATEPAPITIAAISGVTAPARDATPVSTITETVQYTGSVTWNPADSPFAASTVYTATITLTPKTGYTLTGVGSNFFTVAGAATTNVANSGVITAMFPTTSALPVTVESVSVSPESVSVQKGNTQTFTATVSGTNNPAQTVTWSVSGNATSGTAIDDSGLLTVAADEGAATLIVTATSTADNTKSGTATVTVTAVPPVFVPVTDITGVPAAATAGVDLTLTGTVIPANATNQSIVWNIKNAGATGATISGSTLSTAEAGAVIVTATIANGAFPSTNYTQDFNITVNAPPADNTPPTISPVSANYDLSNPGDVTTQIAWNSAQTVTDVVYGLNSLDAGTDYIININTLTIKYDAYLTDLTLTAGDTLAFNITFDTEDTATFTVHVVDGHVPGNNADLDSLLVNGTPVSGFDPDVTAYNVALPYGASSATVTATTSDPNAGYIIAQAPFLPGIATVTVTAEDGTTTKTYTVSFTIGAPPTTYTVTATAGNGGSISPSGIVNVTEGSSRTFIITPNSRYHISSVTVDSIDQGAITTYTFTNVTANHTINATFTRTGGGGDGGNNGGGSSAPPTTAAPAYNADVKAGNSSETTLPVTVDKDTGTASIDAGSQSFALGGTVITIPSIPDVDAYSVGIPVLELSTTKEQGTLTLNTDNGSITVPSSMLAGLSGISGNKAEISIGQGDKNTLPEDVKAAIGDRPLVQLTLTLDGNQTDWNNPNAPVTVSIPYTPTAEELANPESIVIWYIDGAGNVVTVPNGHYDPATGTVIVNVIHFSDYAVAYNKVSFDDVAAGTWYNRAVSFIAARGITGGTGNGNFGPDAKLTRGDFLVMLMKAYGISADSKPTNNFKDSGNTYYTGYLAAAKRLGLTAGVGNNMYAPGKEITRQEMFTLLYNVLKTVGQLPRGDSDKSLSSFSDAGQIASWAKGAMTLLVETGIIGGNNGKLFPAGTTTRAEMAQVLYNLLSKTT